MAGLGAFNTTSSGYGQQYLKQIQAAGQKIAKVGAGTAAFDMEIGRRKAEAESMMGELDDSKMTGTDIKALTGTAERMKENIDGGVETAYDFSNTRSIAKFKEDVAALNEEISKSEKNFIETMGTAEDGPDSLTFFGQQRRREIAMSRGGATEGFTFEDLGGEGIDYYDSTSGDFNRTVRAKSLMDAEVTANPDGTYNMTFTNENGEQETKENLTLEDMRREQREAVMPQYEAVPEVTGANYVIDNNLGPQMFKTADRAASGLMQVVMDPKVAAKAKRRQATRLGSRDVFTLGISQASRQDLIERFGISDNEIGEGFTEAQYEYFLEMMQQWYDMTDDETDGKKQSAGYGRTTDYIDRIDYVGYTMNEEAGDEESTGGMGISLSGSSNTMNLGNVSGGKAQQFGYDPVSGFNIVIEDANGQEYSFNVPIGGDDQQGARAAVMSALNIGRSDLRRLMKAMKARYEAQS